MEGLVNRVWLICFENDHSGDALLLSLVKHENEYRELDFHDITI